MLKTFTLAVLAASLAGAELPMAALRERVLAIETEPSRLGDAIEMDESGMDFPPAVSPALLKALNARISPEGRFAGVDYESKNPSMWKTTRHLDHCRELAIGQAVFPGEKAALENCLKSLDWWLETKPRNSNWWQHQVYEAQMLGSIALLLPEAALTPPRRAALEAFLKKPKPGMTGQNRLWLSWNAVLAGLFMNDEARVEAALRSMGDVITVAKPGQEGIQPDGSFHQHGPHFYQGNYGRHFLHSASKYLRLTAGTPLEDRARVETIERLLLDGTRMMCWGNLLDYNAWGRQITYPTRLQGPDIRVACRNVLAARPARAAEVEAYAASLRDDSRAATPAGTFAYPSSDYLVHRAATFMIGLRLASTRTVAMECVNGDNAKGDFLSQGQTYIYRGGKEYAGVFPLWNWALIPGTTARDIPVKSNPGARSARGGSPIALVSPDGAAAMCLEYKGVSASKSWFFFADRMVCLGSGITCAEPGEVLTTLDQSNLQGGEKPALKGENPVYAEHNGFYWMANSPKMTLLTGPATGNWRAIRPANPNEPVTAERFFLAIGHGEKPQGESYFYQVVDKSAGAPEAAWNAIRVLRHDDICHAVQYRGKTVKAAFFAPGALTLPNGKTLTAPNPGLHSATLQD